MEILVISPENAQMKPLKMIVTATTVGSPVTSHVTVSRPDGLLEMSAVPRNVTSKAVFYHLLYSVPLYVNVKVSLVNNKVELNTVIQSYRQGVHLCK